MGNIYFQEIKRIKNDVQKIECMIVTRENKRTTLKEEHKTLTQKKDSNWQTTLLVKTKIENFNV